MFRLYIIVTKKISFANSELNIPVECDGVRLQPIGKDLFLLAKGILPGSIEVGQISRFFKQIIGGK